MAAEKPTIDLVRQEVVRAAHTVVVKIGTNVITHHDGTLDREHLAHLTEQIAEIREGGRSVVVVSSGAIGAGLGRLGQHRRPTALPALQAAAAIGQCDLINAFDGCLRTHDYFAAQLLLTAEDFDDRTRYLNARNAISQLLQWQCVPIINENDTVSVEEIRFGDNDRLAALVTNLLRAPLLVILSVVDGLYPSDLRDDMPQEPIDKVMQVDARVLAMAGRSTSGLGTGGMHSKLVAAQIATAAGESVWIANGRQPNILRRLMRGERLGTLLPAKGESLAAWKRWVGYTARPRGTFVVDAGAQHALSVDGRSLLPVGVVDVRGDFGPGEVITLENVAGEQFARGLTNYSATEARRIKGLPTAKLAETLPGARYDEVIHRDNLVLLD